jgi:hypothetical protein
VISELHTYVSQPGKRDALVRRFSTGTLALFERHGIGLVGLWVDRTDPDRLYYITSFADLAARDAAWSAFLADPEWQAHKRASEVDGPLLAFRTRLLMEPASSAG